MNVIIAIAYRKGSAANLNAVIVNDGGMFCVPVQPRYRSKFARCNMYFDEIATAIAIGGSFIIDWYYNCF